jgi:hypothetical protein
LVRKATPDLLETPDPVTQFRPMFLTYLVLMAIASGN